MKLKLDVTELAKIISELDLYKETVKVLEEYHVEEEKLDARKAQLEKRVDELKELIKKNEAECQMYKDADDMTTYIHLKSEQKQLRSELEVTEEVASEIKADYTNLKFKYVAPLRQAQGKDGQEKQELFDATKELIQLRFEIYHCLSTLSKAMLQQQVKIWDANEILDDAEVQRRFKTRPITSENATPQFWYQNETFMNKHDVNNALRGGNGNHGNPNPNELTALSKELKKLAEVKEATETKTKTKTKGD
ncbi:hypothetical protein [Priestia megaterium]